MPRNKPEVEVYENNSGTAVGLCGSDYLIIGSDTRHSGDFTINSRTMSKVFELGDFYLVVTGFYADGYELYKKMRYEYNLYELKNGHKMSISSAAQRMMIILYQRRFFPLYVFPLLAGFEEGKPVLYSFDPLGFYEKVKCRAYGSGQEMIEPLLDSFVMKKNRNTEDVSDMNIEQALTFVKDVFDSSAERDVKTGDALEIFLMRESGVDRIMYDLRRD